MEGPTLADSIAAGPISPDEALPIARQIAEAATAPPPINVALNWIEELKQRVPTK